MIPGSKAFLEKAELDALLFVGDSICDADMYYLTRFLATDPFTLLMEEKTSILVSSMEEGRARKESSADEVVTTSEYGIMDKLRKSAKWDDAYLQVLVEFLRDHKVRRLGLPKRFPVWIYCFLKNYFEISLLESPVSRWREVKTIQEIESIRSAQKACERAMRVATDLISASDIKIGILYRNSKPLTSEYVRGQIEISLIEEGYEAVDTIVAGGPMASDPHARGAGELPANAPIVIDIFPRSKVTRYFADMTRTVLKGEASLEIREMYDTVLKAQTVGLKALRTGISGEEVHALVIETFRDQGYPEREGSGFTHSTGHGVGLEVHENPSLGEAKYILQAGNVVTVEPGLYYPDVGGVRLEDLVVIGADSCENLTNFEKELVL